MTPMLSRGSLLPLTVGQEMFQLSTFHHHRIIIIIIIIIITAIFTVTSLPSVNNLKPGSSENHIRTLSSEHSFYRQLTLK